MKRPEFINQEWLSFFIVENQYNGYKQLIKIKWIQKVSEPLIPSLKNAVDDLAASPTFNAGIIVESESHDHYLLLMTIWDTMKCQ